MRRRIVFGVALAVVLAGVGGTVAAFSNSPATPARHRHVSAPTTAVHQPVTKAAGSPTTAVSTTTPIPPPPAPPATVFKAPAATLAPVTSTTLAPAIGGPGGSRFGPTGSPTTTTAPTSNSSTSNASSEVPVAPAIGGPAGSRYGPTGSPSTS